MIQRHPSGLRPTPYPLVMPHKPIPHSSALIAVKAADFRFAWWWVALAALLVAGCDLRERRIFPADTNILLLTVDTLRADHLSSYGYPRQTSPVMDRLAVEGVRFDQVAVQWPKTGPSFASIFTATYPKDNGIVRRVGKPLPQRFLMLAEILRDRGYTTHAVVSNGAVASDFNFNQGFETFIETWKLAEEEGAEDPNGAAVVNELARTVIERLDRSRPYFLWIHYLDPHFPYLPPAAWRDHFQNDAWYDPSRKLEINRSKPFGQLGAIGFRQVLSGKDELDFYVARYDAEIAYTDAQIGELLDDLEQRGLLERTLTVLTSDHGESLSEHSYFFDHGRFSFQTCVRVPLILHYPRVLEPRVDDRPVELIHLTPTILEASGVELPDGVWMQGRSLVPRLLGREQTSPEPLYAHTEAGYATEGRWQKVVRDERYKLIYAPFRSDQRWIGGRQGAHFALFDLVEDPGEIENLAERLPEVVDRLEAELVRWWKPDSFEVLVDGGASEGEAEMSEETRRQLEALGYLQ